ncbi:magnesium chelatase [Trinickia symbiotica]|uniref:Magnesium chelatase n=1 Tax=Trinickia symbiotica TaxID=863227 RepID=A0A2T3XU57_9BURK|nr:VWA domain-containing protein [Trinickia symbiotica]PTB20038.1 magnesium chelatase [Trinickia symbiotica]
MRAGVRPRSGKRIAWPATLERKRQDRLRAEHLRFVREESRTGVLHCFLLDCSASMLGGARLATAKGLLLACFDRAASERAEVALICFGGARADLRFGPAVPRWWNERWLRPIGGGGATPFQLGMNTATRLLERAARNKPGQERVLWVVTDGRSGDCPVKPSAADRVVLVDCENVAPALGRCLQLAREWDAMYVRAEEIAAR